MRPVEVNGMSQSWAEMVDFKRYSRHAVDYLSLHEKPALWPSRLRPSGESAVVVARQALIASSRVRGGTLRRRRRWGRRSAELGPPNLMSKARTAPTISDQALVVQIVPGATGEEIFGGQGPKTAKVRVSARLSLADVGAGAGSG
jgi:hypothetical protein